MPDFLIKIVSLGGGVGFQPDIPGLEAGDPLYVAPNSLVSWNNHTNDPHQVATDDGKYTSDEILPTLSSKMDYYAPATDGEVPYHCAKHDGEIGKIIVTAVVNMAPLSTEENQ